MKKFSVSYATLVFVNAVKFDTGSMDSYDQQNDKIANDLESQYIKAENARLDALDEQETKDAFRQDFVQTGIAAVPDAYIVNNGILSDSIKKTHNTAETYRQDQVDAQEDADAWRKGWTPSSGPVANTLMQEQNPSDFDTYGTQADTLASSIKKQYMQDENDRYSAIDAQEDADAWRAGSTPSPKSMLMQRRAVPDAYIVNNGILSDSIKKTHTNAEAVRQAAVDAQEVADKWRNGFTPSPAPSGFAQIRLREIPDSYTVHNEKLSSDLKKQQEDQEAARAKTVGIQETTDAWRSGFTPSPPVSLYQMRMRAIPDGYTMNNGVLSDSILNTHTNAEKVRNAAVDKQTAADAWRNGTTANTGPVTAPYGLYQIRANPDGYTFNNGVLADSIKKTHTDAETSRAAAVAAQKKADTWRNGFTANSGPVINYAQSDAIPDGYTFNNGVLSDSIKKAHTDAETARAAAVAAQKKADKWRNGFTANSGPVINYAQRYNLVQGQPGPSPTDYGFSFKTMNDKTNTHNDLWWAEQNADVAKQTAVDAWRNGYTANTGPELPYTM